MAGQLGHLITVASLPSVSVGIIPTGLGRDAAWPVEDFWIFDDRQVNVELVLGWLTLTQPREIAMYARTFSERSEIAARGTQARTLITAAIDALGDWRTQGKARHGTEGRAACCRGQSDTRGRPEGGTGELEELRHHWGSAYDIGFEVARWIAQRKDGKGDP